MELSKEDQDGDFHKKKKVNLANNHDEADQCAQYKMIQWVHTPRIAM